MSELDRPGYLGAGPGAVSAPSPTVEYPRSAAGIGADGGWERPPPPYFPPGGSWPPPAPSSPRRHPLRLLAVVLVVTLASAGAVGVSRAVWQAASTLPLWSPPRGRSAVSRPGAQLPVSPPASSPGAPSGSVDLSALAARVDPALVDINTRLGYQNGDAAGTGIVLSSSGEVLTNNHVINGATSIAVTDIGNGQTYAATVVGYDRSHDIAVLQLQGASGLQTASIADSSSVAVGDEIAAIGNAGGRGGTPSIAAGTVAALDQTITVSDDTTGSAVQLAGLIQVAADVQPGDSGGPLVNTAGQVLGVNTAGSAGSRWEPAGGEGLAIPINDAIAISKQINAGTTSSTIHIGPTGILGILVQGPSTQAGHGKRDRPGNPYSSVTSGAVVAGVTPSSPNEQSGLAAGDVIVALGGAAVDSPTTLATLLSG
ncbi:MAG TPA: trypsin-like peptidase domain-containing protein, partial [Pseudonocardiaceae bacterium]|nr:trypsin-like peptidase domain-containing protein [Pseudonocardiaceae bacterium]